MGETTRGPGRRVGARAILDAAVERALEADLADLYGFLTFAEVAKRSDVRPATVQHHFSRRDPDGKPNERLAHAVLMRVVDPADGRATANLDDADATAEIVPVQPEDSLSLLRQLSAKTLREYLDNHPMIRTTMVAASASRVDPATASVLRDWYGDFLDQVVPVYEHLAESFGRRFDTESGFDPASFGVMVTSLTDGLLLRAQFDPDRVDPERYGEVVLRLFEACTVELDDPARERADERLLRSSARPLELPPDSSLDQDKRTAIAVAAIEVYGRDLDAGALTVTEVARVAGVSRTTVVAHFRDGRGLAAVVWASFLPDLEARIVRDGAKGRPPIDRIERFLHRVVELAQEHPELTVLMLEATLASTVRRRNVAFDDPSDPRAVVPLPLLLAPLVQAYRGDDGRPPQAAVFDAATMINLALMRSMSGEVESPSVVIDRTMELLFDGLLHRPDDGLARDQ